MQKKEAKELEEKRKREHRKRSRNGVLKRWPTNKTIRMSTKIARHSYFLLI